MGLIFHFLPLHLRKIIYTATRPILFKPPGTLVLKYQFSICNLFFAGKAAKSWILENPHCWNANCFLALCFPSASSAPLREIIPANLVAGIAFGRIDFTLLRAKA